MQLEIVTVPHRDQRYDTVGDWYVAPDGTWRIQISKLDDWRHWILVAVHELVEMALCTHNNVSSGAVDRFDKAYESNRPEGDVSDPGDSAQAPYKREHCVATAIERLMCAELDVDWEDYEDALSDL